MDAGAAHGAARATFTSTVCPRDEPHCTVTAICLSPPFISSFIQPCFGAGGVNRSTDHHFQAPDV